MICSKCQGRMRSERFHQHIRSHESYVCVNCGDMVDPVIAGNRARNVEPEFQPDGRIPGYEWRSRFDLSNERALSKKHAA